MKDNSIIKIAAIGLIGLAVIPVCAGVGVNLIGHAANGICNLAYKRKIKERERRISSLFSFIS